MTNLDYTLEAVSPNESILTIIRGSDTFPIHLFGGFPAVDRMARLRARSENQSSRLLQVVTLASDNPADVSQDVTSTTLDLIAGSMHQRATRVSETDFYVRTPVDDSAAPVIEKIALRSPTESDMVLNNIGSVSHFDTYDVVNTPEFAMREGIRLLSGGGLPPMNVERGSAYTPGVTSSIDLDTLRVGGTRSIWYSARARADFGDVFDLPHPSTLASQADKDAGVAKPTFARNVRFAVVPPHVTGFKFSVSVDASGAVEYIRFEADIWSAAVNASSTNSDGEVRVFRLALLSNKEAEIIYPETKPVNWLMDEYLLSLPERPIGTAQDVWSRMINSQVQGRRFGDIIADLRSMSAMGRLLDVDRSPFDALGNRLAPDYIASLTGSVAQSVEDALRHFNELGEAAIVEADCAPVTGVSDVLDFLSIMSGINLTDVLTTRKALAQLFQPSTVSVDQTGFWSYSSDPRPAADQAVALKDYVAAKTTWPDDDQGSATHSGLMTRDGASHGAEVVFPIKTRHIGYITMDTAYWQGRVAQVKREGGSIRSLHNLKWARAFVM